MAADVSMAARSAQREGDRHSCLYAIASAGSIVSRHDIADEAVERTP